MSQQNDAQRLGLEDPFKDVRGPWGDDRRRMYYDRSGNEITFAEYIALGLYSVENADEYRRVAEDTVGPYWVSTVWLGINHRYGDGPPLIFETMVFSDDDEDEYQRRYSTELEAINGHLETVESFSTLVESRRKEGR